MSARVTVKDIEVCGLLGPNGVHCAHTLSAATEDFTAQQWNQMSVGWLCMSPQSFSDTESSIAQFCNAYPNLCDYQTVSTLKRVLRRIKRLTKVKTK